MGDEGSCGEFRGKRHIIRPGETEVHDLILPDSQATLIKPTMLPDGSILTQNSTEKGCLRLAPDNTVTRIDPPPGVQRIVSAAGMPDGTIYAIGVTEDKTTLLRFTASPVEEKEKVQEMLPRRQF